MTLNLTIVAPGASGNLLTNRVTSGNDESVKQLIIRCTDESALVAYAGMGLYKGVELSDWIREFLRGETRSLRDTLILLRDRATQDLGSELRARQWRHMFTVGAL